MNTSTLNRLIALVVVLVVVAVGAVFLLVRTDDGAPAAAETDGTPSQPVADTASTRPAGGLAAADLDGDGVVYQSGMHPWIVEDAPGTCPICGMDLVPVKVGGVEEGTVRIDPVTMQNIGVRTARVDVAPLQRTVRTTGRFEGDEQRTAVVSPKVGGWVEELHVNYEGARVGKGAPLFDLYSPELVSTQEEYLLALRNRERLAGTPAEADAERLVQAARRRLAFWDITDEQIRRLEATGEPTKTLTLYAPAAGTVTETTVVEGQKVNAGQTLMRLADLSRLWLMVDVYEQDLAWVGVGTEAMISLPYAPGETLRGRVNYLYDELDLNTRTVRARVVVPNPGLALKPGMYATVQLEGRPAEPTPVVPSEAVITTGDRAVVILALGEGRFRPQPVTTGVEADGRVQVLGGLAGDEVVVTSAQFLIDSEARLASAVSAMMDAHAGHGTPPSTGDTAPETPETPAAESRHAEAPSTDTPPTDAPRQVAGASPAQGAVQIVEIDITGAAFEPAQIEVEAGVPTKLVFTRHTDRTCATDVMIPELGVEATPLPMHEPVAIEVVPPEDGTFTFACGMDMIKGTLVVGS